jgi:hypothetical protein
MSYNNPSTGVTGATGLNAAIESIRSSLAALTWLEKSFGRAWEFKEKNTEDRTISIPKVFMGQTDNKEGEYLNVLPNDFLKAQSFIKMAGPEEWTQFNRYDGSMKSRKISIIFWCNLKEIDVSKNYIFTDELKDQVEDILRKHPSISSLDAYYDERAEDIFNGYSLEEVETQYLMYPYAGFRVDCTISYGEVC